MSTEQTPGPLAGHRVIELAGIGPGPFACTMLADLGCQVVRIDRLAAGSSALPDELVNLGVRGRTTIAIDLKSDEGQEVARALIDAADIVLEGFRPGVAERLGVGPERFDDSNRGLIYARLTGWGQDGPYADMAGHDINYIGLTGALAAIGVGDRPIPPLNLLGDYAGGSMFAVVGILSALVERTRTGRGQVIDIAMIDGVTSLMEPVRNIAELGMWVEQRSSNMLDGGAPFYRAYRTSDDRFMAVGALEPAFYTSFVSGLGFDEDELPNRFDPENWSGLGSLFSEAFASEDLDHWQGVFDGTDSCVTPILRMSESPTHPQMQARPKPPEAGDPKTGDVRAVLSSAGITGDQIDELIADGVMAAC